jgi:hypothetical protein
MAISLAKAVFFVTAFLLNWSCNNREDRLNSLEMVRPSAEDLGKAAASKGFSFNMMAPLTLPQDEAGWASLSNRLKRVKELGGYAVTTDVWWGIVEKDGDNQFNWSAYLRLADTVTGSGLKWVPILSFHQCGGNVGDDCNFPIPAWLWDKYPEAITVSEFGNVAKEALSVWSTTRVLSQYQEFMESFAQVFERYSKDIAEINISFGPSGELRYPSYNSHDLGKTAFPSRGGFQGYSPLARESFRAFILKKYGNLNAVNSAWKTKLNDPSQIDVPGNPSQFYETKAWQSRYGRDLYTWYHESLLEHGRLMGEASIDTFSGPTSPMRGIELGAKVPGIHWRMKSDRLAELNAGLTLVHKRAEPSSQDYDGIASLFSSLDKKAAALSSRFVFHFTCLEMSDNEGGVEAASLAKTLVVIVGKAAKKYGLIVKGENALAGTLAGQPAWDNMKFHVFAGPYKGLTILRLDDVIGSEIATKNFTDIVQRAAR